MNLENRNLVNLFLELTVHRGITGTLAADRPRLREWCKAPYQNIAGATYLRPEVCQVYPRDVVPSCNTDTVLPSFLPFPLKGPFIIFQNIFECAVVLWTGHNRGGRIGSTSKFHSYIGWGWDGSYNKTNERKAVS